MSVLGSEYSIHVRRHDVDPQVAVKLVEVTTQAQAALVARIAEGGNAWELAGLRSNAIAGAAARCVMSVSAVEIKALVRVASQAGGAIWELAENPEAQVELDLPAGSIRVVGRIDEGFLSSPEWLECLWLATHEDDRRSMRALCRSTRDLRASSTGTDEHNHLFADAMRKHAVGDPDARATALRALALAESGPHVLSADWVRAVDAPIIEVGVHVLARDAIAADRAVLKAFESHRAYWGEPSRRNRNKHWISLPLGALMTLARRAGLQLTTTSDYAPPELID